MNQDLIQIKDFNERYEQALDNLSTIKEFLRKKDLLEEAHEHEFQKK